MDVYPTSSIVVEGNNITLSCNASGKPEPVISWAKVGEAGQVLSQSSSFTVTNVTSPRNPDHMIQYQCTASNGVESPATVIANITVLRKYHSVKCLNFGQFLCIKISSCVETSEFIQSKGAFLWDDP